MTLLSSNAALAPHGRATPFASAFPLCCRDSVKTPAAGAAVDYCCLWFLGILKNMELPDGILLQAANHRPATAACCDTQWCCCFLSLLLPRLCPDTFTVDSCRLLFDFLKNRRSPLRCNAHLLPLSLCIAERKQQQWALLLL